MRRIIAGLFLLLALIVAPIALKPIVSPSTSTPAVRPTPSPAPTPTSGRLLRWHPPVMRNPVTHHVGGSEGATYSAPTGQDTVIVFDSPVTTRLDLSGGHNWRIIGGEININGACSTTDACNGLTVSGATGVIYVEGIYMHGKTLNDGLKGDSPHATWIMQNSLIKAVHGRQSAYHADLWQPYDGFEHFFMDYVTGYTTMQGGLIKTDGPGTWNQAIWSHVNVVVFDDRDSWPIDVVLNGTCKGPMRVSDFYLLPDPDHNGGTLSGNMAPAADFQFVNDESGAQVRAYWNRPDLFDFSGDIIRGRPAGGDFVTPSGVGLGYVSPGYLP